MFRFIGTGYKKDLSCTGGGHYDLVFAKVRSYYWLSYLLAQCAIQQVEDVVLCVVTPLTICEKSDKLC
jgi:hypothetical protein